jgi:small ligand-binding sensory domain FIST
VTSGHRLTRITSSLSTHPVAAAAAGEVIGDALERVGMHPDVTLLFVTGAHVEFARELAATVTATIRPRVLVTATGRGVLGGGREVLGSPGVVLWCAAIGSVRPFVLSPHAPARRLDFGRSPAAVVVLGTEMAGPDAMTLERWSRAHPSTAFVGARVGSGSDGLVLLDGMPVEGVALAFDDARLAAVCATRTRPVGPTLVATAVHRHAITEFDDQPAQRRIEDVIASLDSNERSELRTGIFAGIAAPQSGFELAEVLGMQRQTGSVVLNRVVETGSVVELRVLDDDAAGQSLLDETFADRRPVTGALTFLDRSVTKSPVNQDHEADESFRALDEWMSVSPGGVVGDSVIGSLGGRTAMQSHAISALIFR